MSNVSFKIRPISFGRILWYMIACTLCILVICITLVFYSVNRVSEKHIQDVGDETLRYYQSVFDNALQSADSYCEANFNTNIATTMYQARDPMARKQLQEEIGQLLQTLEKMNGVYFAAVIPENSALGESIVRSNCSSMKECTELLSALEALIHSDSNAGAYASWYWHPLSEKNYLVKIKKYQDIYCVVLIDTQFLHLLNSEAQNCYLFCADDQSFFSDNEAVKKALSEKTSQQNLVHIDGKQFLVLTTPAESGNFSIGMLLATSATNISRELFRGGIILVLLLLIMGTIFLLLLRRLKSFFSTMNNACNQVAGGDIDTQIAAKGRLEDEIRLYQTFNHMAGQIRELRIGLYEQELSTQSSKMNFLQAQIKSHFFLNCLNTIHSLALIEDTQLIQEFTLCLSDYFRYLGSSFSDTVRLSSELVHLQNYIQLNQIRYPGRIFCTYSISPELETQLILPMLPQTFVENIFKHALGSSNIVQIGITAAPSATRRGMDFVIQDDGPGFSPEALHRINQPCSASEGFLNADAGTGIQNTKERMNLYYDGQATVQFENTQPHGAVVRLFIPALEELE